MDIKDYQLVNHEIIFSDDYGYFKIAKDSLNLPDQKTMDYYYIQCSSAAAVVAVNLRNEILITQQYRHPLGKIIFDLPAGAMQEGETPEECAIRELQEETGVVAKNLIHLGKISPSPGRMKTWVDLFLAQGLNLENDNQDETEFIEKTFIPYEVLMDKIRNKEMVDMTLLSALFLAQPYLSK